MGTRIGVGLELVSVQDCIFRKSLAVTNLRRVRALANMGGVALRNRFIHVAGTNGKGSTCAFLESGLRAAGLRTGLYTSPHLIRWNERIRICGKCIGDEDFAEILNRWGACASAVAAADATQKPSGFEVLTVAALDYFHRTAVDVAIIEAGLGGRLDATNIIQPDICAISTIGEDHADVLGDGEERISWEKAGILKRGVAAVVGNVSRVSLTTVQKVANSVGAKILRPDPIAIPPLQFLRGSEQVENFQLAATIARRWLEDRALFSNEIWEKFLEGAARAQWPGRWDLREIDGRTWIFDGTHNGHGLMTLRENLRHYFPSHFPRLSVVCAALGQRRASDILPFLSSVASELFLVELKEPRALSGETLRKFVPAHFFRPVNFLSEGQLAELPHVVDSDCILVSGSLHLVGKTMESLNVCPFSE
jgi:dihydrofolate synthase/folylpolyglutamate synthase